MDTKFSIYEMVTEKIIQILETGVCPWRKPWTATDVPASNFVSKKAYTGVNAFLLAYTGHSCPYFVTYKQAVALGGNVRKGEVSTVIVFWTKFDKVVDGKNAGYAMLRYYRVFNLEQCEGIAWEKPAVRADFVPVNEAEKIVAGMVNAPKIAHEGGRAFYFPAIDKITLPVKETFIDGESYYSTLFHELIHATGHTSRLNREGVKTGEDVKFGSDMYAKEELIAEMGASFLNAHAGISAKTEANNASYIAGWIAKLKSDSRLVVSAAAKAQQACNHILPKQRDTAETEEG